MASIELPDMAYNEEYGDLESRAARRIVEPIMDEVMESVCCI